MISWKYLLPRFVFISVILTVITASITSLFYYSEIETANMLRKSRETINVVGSKEAIDKNLRNIAADLMVLSQHTAFTQADTSSIEIDGLIKDMLILMKEKRIYDQLRFIDKTGMEVVRINFSQKQPYSVAADKLQNKANRYYFKETLELSTGEVFISPFDLNVEHGKIELPYKPMIRLSTPVFDKQGYKRGIVIINYFGVELIHDLLVAASGIIDHITLLNSDSYWLRNPKRGLEWGFMLKNDKHFKGLFPGSWERIIAADSGQFYDSNGFFTFETAYPLSKDSITGTSIKAVNPPISKYYWKLVSHISPATIDATNVDIGMKMIRIAGPLYLLMMLGSFWIAYGQARRKQIEDALQAEYDKLEQRVEERTIELSKVNEALSVDITKRKQTEKELSSTVRLLQNVFNASQDLIFVKDTQFRTIMCNDIFAQATGQKPEDLYGRTDTENGWFPGLNLGNPKKGIREFEADDRDVLNGKTIHIPCESINIHDEIRYFDTIKVPLRDESDNIVGVLGLARDITERKQNEEMVRRSQKMEAVGQLTGGIAHDFNNILGIIMGNLELLKRQVAGDEKISGRVVTIGESAKRAADLTKQLLAFSRQQATDVVVSNINRVIQEMDRLIKHSITPEVVLNLQLAGNLWVTGINNGDFQDSLLNLILNARDAMPGGGQLTVETRNCTLDKAYCVQHPDTTPGEYVLVSVSDTGEGIASDQIDKIFDPFYTTKEVGKGTGLGLSMVFGFITRSNGHVAVESEPGAGTTFHLYLPRTEGQVSVDDIADQQPKTQLQGSETILVVDDEKELLNLARESLETLGYHVLTATNSEEALEQLAEHPDISLLFSDVVMPGGMNGYELAEQAMEEHSNLKILLTSGHTEKASGQAQKNYKQIMKPYTLEELTRWVQSLLGESKNTPG